MSDDPDSFPEREMKDFQFRQMKKIRVFDSPPDIPKDRSSLLTISNKFGLTFVGLGKMLKVFFTKDVLAACKGEGSFDEIVEGVKALEVPVELPLHHLALSCDELTLSVCGMSEEAGLSLAFYDVRTFLNKARQEKAPFAFLRPGSEAGTLVQDLKWNPAQASMLAVCLSDGTMMVLEVTTEVKVTAQLPAAVGITSVCWSPKGKQVAAGKQDATVIQYTPALQEKKVIPCPPFYTSDNPVKVLDVLWLSTFNFAVTYAAADGAPETPPELVVVSLPKKDEKRAERYLNFMDPVYGTCTERQHHYFLSHVEDWDLVLAASAASIEVSIIAKQEDKTNWELWVLEDSSRAELPVTQSNDDTLPLGLAIDYTCLDEIIISDDKKLPPAPTLMLLSTDGILCPYSLLNTNAGAKELVTPATNLALDGERPPSTGFSLGAPQSLKSPPSNTFAPLRPPTISSTPPPTATVPPSAPAVDPASAPVPGPATMPSSFSFSQPSVFGSTAPPAPSSSTSSVFSLGSSLAGSSTTSSAAPPPAFSASSVFSFSAAAAAASKQAPAASSSAPLASASAFSFSVPSVAKPPQLEASSSTSGVTPPTFGLGSTPQRLVTASPLTVAKEAPTPRLNLSDRFSAVETPPPAYFSSVPKVPQTEGAPAIATISAAATKPVATMPTIQAKTSSPAPKVVQDSVTVKALEKQLQQKKDSDPVMAGILEEIAHFQRELEEAKVRSSKADFSVGSSEEMRELRKEAQDLHVFTLEIKETTESLHGDISTLKTTLLEGFAGAEDAKAHCELNNDPSYLQLLYKKPLDPRRDQQLKEIRRLYQYVKFAVEDVNDVLDLEWEKHLENRKKLRHMVIPERHVLFNALANNLEIISQQRLKLEQLVRDLHSLRLFNKTAAWTSPSLTHSTPSEQSLDKELEGLREALLKANLETSPKTSSKSPAKMTPAKQAQLRNFLSKRQTPHVRSTAPANLSRSAFLSPKYYEDLDDVSSTSSLSQPLEEEEELQVPGGALVPEEEDEVSLPPLAPLPTMAPTSVPRHQAVVRTPSIQPGFTMQSTPFAKGSPTLGLGISPVLSNKINLGGPESTALATKTVKHGAPPAEKATPVAITAQKAAADAALRRQMANQRPVGTSLTESTLKTVPQVVNVQELKDKGPTLPVSTVISSSVPGPAVEVVQQVLRTVGTNQAKRNPPQGPMKVTAASADSSTPPQTGFVFGAKADTPATSAATSGEEQSSKGFSFSAGASSFAFSAPQQGKDGGPPKFSFGSTNRGSMKLFGGPSDKTSSPSSIFTPKSASPALGVSTNSPTPPPVAVSGEPLRLSSSSPAIRVEPQTSRPASSSSSSSSAASSSAPPLGGATGAGGETLGSFSCLRVGQGDEEVKDTPKATPSFTFGQPANSKGNGGFGATPATFSFGKPSLQGEAQPEPSNGGAVSIGAFKPAESTPSSSSKPAFSLTHPTTYGLLTAPLQADSSIGTAEASPPTEAQEAQTTTTIVPASPSPPLSVDESVTPTPADKPPTPPSPSPAPVVSPTPTPTSGTPPVEAAPVPDPEPSSPCPPEPAPSPAPAPTPTPEVALVAPTGSTTPTCPTSVPEPSAPAAPTPPPPSSDKPGSIFTQPPAASTPASGGTTVGLSNLTTSVITTAVPTSTATPEPLSTTASVPDASAPTQAPALTPDPTPSQVPAPVAPIPANTSTPASVFGQPANPPPPGSSPAPPVAFGTAPAQAQTAFGTTPAVTPASSVAPTGFGKPVFGQVGAFGQPATGSAPSSAAAGFSFGQSTFGTSPATTAFGQPAVSGAQAATPSASGGGLFGSAVASAPGSGASSFSFGTSAASSTGGGSLFGQTPATPAFGQQSSGFGQAAPVFGSNTTTTSSSGFSFGQPSAFGSTPSSSVFGQQPSSGGGSSLFGQAPSSGGLFGSGSAGSAAPSSGGGFFSGLGGKPSEDAANKNPFGATAGTGFGQPSQGGGTSLFGNSGGAKAFSFGGSSFGEQKSSGTFTAGGGSVAQQGFGSFGATPTKPASGGFGSAPVFGSPPAFGGAPAFGGGATFGASPSFSSPMGSSGGKVFGEGTAAANMGVGGFGFANTQNTPTFGSIANQSAPSFGNLAQQQPSFGQPQGFGSGFGGGGGGFTGGFGSTNQSSQSTYGSGWRS